MSEPTSSADNDGYDAAIGTDESAPADASGAAPGSRGAARDDEPDDSSNLSDVILGGGGGAATGFVEHNPVYRIGIKDSTRKLFAAAQPKIQAALEEGDEYEPAIPTTEATPVTPPVAVPPARPAAAPAAAATPAAPAAPAQPAPAGSSLADLMATPPGTDQRAMDLDLREKALADRETALTARDTELVTRAKDLDALATIGTRYLDRGEDEIIDRLKEWTGASTEEELREEAAALIAGLSAKILKIPVDPEIASKALNRRSVQRVKAYTADIDRKQRALDERIARERESDLKRREEETKAADAQRLADKQRNDEERATRGLTVHLQKGADADGVPFTSKFPHLMAEENAPAIVMWLVKRKAEREPAWETNWQEIAALAETHYRNQNEARHARTVHLFTPATPAAPATPSTPAQHQGAPAQGRGARTLTNRDVAPVPPAQPQRPADPAGEPEEFNSAAHQRDHRRASLGRLKADLAARTATERESGT